MTAHQDAKVLTSRTKRCIIPVQAGIHLVKITCCILALIYAPFSYGSDKVNALSTDDVAKNLGWISDSKANQCGGYYVEPNLQSTDPNISTTASTSATQISADQSALTNNGVSTLSGNVILDQPGRHVMADNAVLNRNAQTGKITTVDFYGMVQMREPSKVAVGDTAHLDFANDKGIYDDVIYRMALNFQPVSFTKTDDNQYQVHGLFAQGSATKLEQTKKNYYILHQATYSTCTPVNNSWHISAKQIDLNKDTGRGVARHAVLYAKGVPVFYSPYLSFPIDKRRVSGFLSPTFGNSRASGNSLTVPYYWNIAPNYDMTITPEWFSKRGVLLDTSNRYLTERSQGNLEVGVLPDDRAFYNFKQNAIGEYSNPPNPALPQLENSGNTRWYYGLKNMTNFSPNLQSKIDYTRVSDDYVQQDFGIHSQTAAQLLQQASLNYNGTFWNAQLLLQQYQTLHPVTLLANSNQYDRLPDLTYNINYLSPSNFNYLLNSEAVEFHRDLNPGEIFNSASGNPTSGARSHIEPGISYPWSNNYAFVKPTVQWDLTQYDVVNQPNGYANHIGRSLPLTDVDSGLYFDRDLNLFKQDYNQTLEPRFYYLYVPYRSQYQIPVFDTSIQTFTFDQLFQNNRFSGIDRIGDANQFSTALVSRFISSDTGVEKAKVGIGRIFYRQKRHVMLCNTFGCEDSQFAVGSTSPNENASPVVGFANYHINDNWSAVSNVAYDPNTHAFNNGNINLQYIPIYNHVFNIGYNFVQYGDPASPPTPNPNSGSNNLNQAAASFAWPVTNTVDAMAAWNYNISHKHFQTYFYGVGYNACCYAVRVALTRTFYALSGNGNPQFNRQILLQFILKGFGGVGQNNMLGALTSNVPGYVDPFNKNII